MYSISEWARLVAIYSKGHCRGQAPAILAELGENWLEIRAPTWAPVDLVGTRRWFAGGDDKLFSVT